MWKEITILHKHAIFSDQTHYLARSIMSKKAQRDTTFSLGTWNGVAIRKTAWQIPLKMGPGGDTEAIDPCITCDVS